MLPADGPAGAGDGALDIGKTSIDPLKARIDGPARGPAVRDCGVGHTRPGKAFKAKEPVADHRTAGFQGFLGVVFDRLLGEGRDEAQFYVDRLTVAGFDGGEKRGLTRGPAAGGPLTFAARRASSICTSPLSL